MKDNPSGATPRVTYAKPTEKAQYGKPPDLGTDIKRYRLPEVDVDSERRNFPGYGVDQYFTMEDLLGGDTSGTTDTDSTAPEDKYESRRGSGYTKINSKKIKMRRVN